MSNPIVTLCDISKKYTISHQRSGLISTLLGINYAEDFWALKKVNMRIFKGDRVGIIGPNGAGKTTLLKIIAGITKPSTGRIQTRGKVVALIDIEAGFHPELTGEENIYINGMLVGMSRNEVDAKKEQIIDFATIGKFINAPFYTYSSGMKFRLAFAVAIASECEVLIMDEIFMVGDNEFQEKTFTAFKELSKDKEVTLILSTHSHSYVRGLTSTYYRMVEGKLTKIASKNFSTEVIAVHQRWQQNLGVEDFLSGNTTKTTR